VFERFPVALREAIRANGGAVVTEFDAGTGEAMRPSRSVACGARSDSQLVT
jgi:hypothetical protein